MQTIIFMIAAPIYVCFASTASGSLSAQNTIADYSEKVFLPFEVSCQRSGLNRRRSDCRSKAQDVCDSYGFSEPVALGTVFTRDSIHADRVFRKMAFECR